MDQPHEDVDACLARMVQRCENERQQAELRVRQVLDDSSRFEREHLQQVDARLQPVRDDAGRRVTLRFDGMS